MNENAEYLDQDDGDFPIDFPAQIYPLSTYLLWSTIVGIIAVVIVIVIGSFQPLATNEIKFFISIIAFCVGFVLMMKDYFKKPIGVTLNKDSFVFHKGETSTTVPLKKVIDVEYIKVKQSGVVTSDVYFIFRTMKGNFKVDYRIQNFTNFKEIMRDTFDLNIK